MAVQWAAWGSKPEPSRTQERFPSEPCRGAVAGARSFPFPEWPERWGQGCRWLSVPEAADLTPSHLGVPESASQSLLKRSPPGTAHLSMFGPGSPEGRFTPGHPGSLEKRKRPEGHRDHLPRLK